MFFPEVMHILRTYCILSNIQRKKFYGGKRYMYKIYSDGDYSICVSEYVDQYSIICKKDNFKIAIYLYKDGIHVYFKAYENKVLFYKKFMTSYHERIKNSTVLKRYLLTHVYIENTIIQLMIINTIDIFYKNL